MGNLKPLVVGMNPGPRNFVSKNSSIGRLNSWFSEIGIHHYAFVNVWHVPGTFRKSEVDTEFLSSVLRTWDGPVVALGLVPSSVLDEIGVSHLRIPHPSFRNRVYNDPETVRVTVKLIKEFTEVESCHREDR